MIRDKLENIDLRAKMLLGQVSPAAWQALRKMRADLAGAIEQAQALEAGEVGGEDVMISSIITDCKISLRALGGVAESFSYEAILPLIHDLENLLPLVEALEETPQLVARAEPDAPLPAA